MLKIDPSLKTMTCLTERTVMVQNVILSIESGVADDNACLSVSIGDEIKL